MLRMPRLTLWPLEKRARHWRAVKVAAYSAMLIYLAAMFLPNIFAIGFFEMIGVSQTLWWLIILVSFAVLFVGVMAAAIVVGMHSTREERWHTLIAASLGIAAMLSLIYFSVELYRFEIGRT